MSDPNDLRAFWDLAWQHLARGAADARHPARYPTFATVSPEGWPEARTVALRAAAASQARLEVHTDTQTAKMRAIAASGRAALHVWVPKADLQVRVQAAVEVVTGPQAEAAWQRVPAASRVSYGTQPAPGTPIPSVHAYDKPPERGRFAVVICRAEMVDLVQLGARHRRAGYSRADGFVGQWLAP